MLYSVFYLIIGIFVLFYSGDQLVKGSSALAKKWGLSQFFVGLTIVALGTSLPEFFVSLTAAVKGSDGIAIGNILGSNIANIAVVLALTFILLKKIELKKNNKINLLFFFLSTFLFFVISFYEYTNRYYSVFLLLVFILFIYFSFKNSKETKVFDESKDINVYLNLLLVILGIFGLYFGSNILVNSGIKIARFWGVSELFIGATVMAVGTSLPELTASIVSIIRKKQDIAIANILGSNIFNVLFALATVSVIKPLKVDASIKFLDFPFLILMTVLTLFSFYKNKYKSVGIVLLISYLFYVSFVFYRN